MSQGGARRRIQKQARHLFGLPGADLDHQPPPTAQKRQGRRQNAVEIETVQATIKRCMGVMQPHLGLQTSDVFRRDIGWIGNDEVELTTSGNLVGRQHATAAFGET